MFGHEKARLPAPSAAGGRLRLAEGGTCFLDEVGNLPIQLQAKLLRVLESGQVQPVGAERTSSLDMRFVAATNYDLPERVARGLFRPTSISGWRNTRSGCHHSGNEPRTSPT